MFVLLTRNVGFLPPTASQSWRVQGNHDNAQSRQKKVVPTEPNWDTYFKCAVYMSKECKFNISLEWGPILEQNVLFSWPVSNSNSEKKSELTMLVHQFSAEEVDCPWPWPHPTPPGWTGARPYHPISAPDLTNALLSFNGSKRLQPEACGKAPTYKCPCLVTSFDCESCAGRVV